MKRVLQTSKLNTDLDCNDFSLANFGSFNPMPPDVLASDDPRLDDQRTPVDGSVTDSKVSSVAGITQDKLSLNGTMPPAWIGTGSNQAAQGNLVERASHKGAASGYAQLDSNGRVPVGLLASTGPQTGTVTSVGLFLPAEFALSGSPVVSGAGTFTVSWNLQPNNSWFGANGPVS